MSKQNKKESDQSKGYQTKLSMFYGGKQKHQQKPYKEPTDPKERDEKLKRIYDKLSSRQQKRQNNQMIKESREHSNKSHTEKMSSLSARSNSPVIVVDKVEKKEAPKQLNVQFYLNQMPSQPYGQYIDKMHQLWYNDYKELERNHSFIQWIFPNSFQSRFNMHARPLSASQAEQFRTNPKIIKRYIKSYEMMLAFYGMKLKDKETGQLMRSRHPDYKQRYFKTLLTSFHNHMRITRILCSLKQTGFSKFSVELCKFLKAQIYSSNGQLGMLKRYNVYKDWQPFEQLNSEGLPKSIYFDMINRHRQNNESKAHLKVQKTSKFDDIRSSRSPSHQKQSSQRKQQK